MPQGCSRRKKRREPTGSRRFFAFYAQCFRRRSSRAAAPFLCGRDGRGGVVVLQKAADLLPGDGPEPPRRGEGPAMRRPPEKKRCKTRTQPV